MIVVDASIVATALVDDESPGHLVRDRLRGESLAAPSLLDLEVVSVVRRLAQRETITVRRAHQAIADLARLRVRRHHHTLLLSRCWDLRANLTPYDGAYVALAERLDVALITADARLGGAAGVDCDIEILR